MDPRTRIASWRKAGEPQNRSPGNYGRTLRDHERALYPVLDTHTRPTDQSPQAYSFRRPSNVPAPRSTGWWSVVALVLLTSAALVAQPGCERIGSRTVQAEFRSVEGLGSERPVYLAGVQIGTTGVPIVVDGRAQVPIRIWHSQRDALPLDSVFAIATDPNLPSELCLIVYEVPSLIPRDENGTQVFPGASTEMELAVLIGVEKARALWELLGRP